jgi:hypothetical protein
MPCLSFQGRLLLAVLAAASFAAFKGGGSAAWSNTDPSRTLLVAEPNVVGSVALAVWYWAHSKRALLARSSEASDIIKEYTSESTPQRSLDKEEHISESTPQMSR